MLSLLKHVHRHCRKSVQMESLFGPNTGKYGPEKTPYFDAFHAVRDPSNTFKDENLSKVGVQQMLSKSSLVSETYQ